MSDPNREFDKTSLHSSVHGYVVHRDYAATFFSLGLGVASNLSRKYRRTLNTNLSTFSTSPRGAIEMNENIQWRKVNRPRSWRPKNNGEELIGYYCGRTLRNGQWGQYEVVTVVTPNSGALMVSGTHLIQLADVAMLKYGDAIRIKFLGVKPVGDGHEMKEFELYVSDTELTAEDVIQVKRTVDEEILL